MLGFALVIVILLFVVSYQRKQKNQTQPEPAGLTQKAMRSTADCNAATVQQRKIKKDLCEPIKKAITDKFYLDPDITLPQTASRLRCNRNDLSAYINCCYDKNFSQWINDMRIEEAIEIMTARKGKKFRHIDIYPIAGFNNFDTYNRAFKAYAHMKPTEFMNSALNDKM